MLVLILLVIAAVCLGLAAFGTPAGRLNLVAAGLFFFVCAALDPVLRTLN